VGRKVQKEKKEGKKERNLYYRQIT